MPEYTAKIVWERGSQDFLDKRYSRRHRIEFDGGAELPGSSSPHSVPVPYSDLSAADPEEMLVAAVSSCHMLWFLALAADQGFRVDSYVDEPVAIMGKNELGFDAIVSIELRPEIRFEAPAPDAVQLAALHHDAHARCCLANSVSAEVVVRE